MSDWNEVWIIVTMLSVSSLHLIVQMNFNRIMKKLEELSKK